MKCMNCGKHFRGKFCPNCGTEAPEVKDKVNVSKSTIILIVAIFIILVGIIIFLLLKPSSDNVSSTTSPPSPSPTASTIPATPSPSAANDENYLIGLQSKEEEFIAPNGDIISKTVLRADKSDVKKMTGEEFFQFYHKKILGKGYDDYYLVFEDNSGILFTHSTTLIAYGIFNDNLNLVQIDKVITFDSGSAFARDCKTDSGKPYKLPDADSITVGTAQYDTSKEASIETISATAKRAFGDLYEDSVFDPEVGLISISELDIQLNLEDYKYSSTQALPEWDIFLDRTYEIVGILDETKKSYNQDYNIRVSSNIGLLVL